MPATKPASPKQPAKPSAKKPVKPASVAAKAALKVVKPSAAPAPSKSLTKAKPVPSST